MINNQTAEATETINNFSDTQMKGTGIGQSNPEINLNAVNKPYIRAPKEAAPKEAAPTKQEQTYGDIMSEINKNESLIDKINELLDLEMNRSEKNLSERSKSFRHLQQLLGIETWDELTTSKSELLNSIKELKEHKNFDNRTDEQKRSDKLLEEQREREDTTAQRGTQDMLKAGLHPASANYGGSVGGSSGGGGGGSGSESEKEKERRRRRKKYLEDKKREEKVRKRRELMQVLGMISGIGGAVSLGTMQNVGRRKQEQTRGQNLLEREQTRGQNQLEREQTRGQNQLAVQKQRDNAAYVRELEKKERMGFYKEGAKYFSR